MDKYRWNILGLCKMRWTNFGETTTEEGHKVFFSGKEHKHVHGVGFLVHKDIINTVIGCCPIFSKVIRLRVDPFNIKVVQAYYRFADDIDGLAGEEEELANLVERLDKASTAYGMEISAEKTKLMTKNTSGINTEIKVNGQKLESHKLQIPGLSYN